MTSRKNSHSQVRIAVCILGDNHSVFSDFEVESWMSYLYLPSQHIISSNFESLEGLKPARLLTGYALYSGVQGLRYHDYKRGS